MDLANESLEPILEPKLLMTLCMNQKMRPARSPILCSKLTMMTVLECQQGSKKFVLGPASTAFVCNVSEKGDRIHRCMHCSLRKDLRCMHILFERRRPGHASLFDRGLVSPVRCRIHLNNPCAFARHACCRLSASAWNLTTRLVLVVCQHLIHDECLCFPFRAFLFWKANGLFPALL